MCKKVLVCVLVFLMAAFCLSACAQGADGLQYDNADRYIVDIGEYVVDISEVEIYWLCGSVRIATGDVEKVQLSEVTSREKYPTTCRMRSYVDGNKLFIAFGEAGERNLTNIQKDLTVTFPKEMQLKKVTVKATSADVELQNTLTVDSLHAETTSGKIKAEFSSPYLIDFSAKTKSGNIVATFTKATSPVMDIETVSGRTSVVAMNVESVRYKSKSGYLYLTVPSDVEYSASLNTKFGKITSEYEELTRGEGNVKIEAETFTGKVIIKKA